MVFNQWYFFYPQSIFVHDVKIMSPCAALLSFLCSGCHQRLFQPRYDVNMCQPTPCSYDMKPLRQKSSPHTHPTLIPFPDGPRCPTPSPQTSVKFTACLWLGHSFSLPATLERPSYPCYNEEKRKTHLDFLLIQDESCVVFQFLRFLCVVSFICCYLFYNILLSGTLNLWIITTLTWIYLKTGSDTC